MSKACAIPKSFFPLKFKVNSPVHALQLARKLIAPFKHWTTGALAVADSGDDHGIELPPKSASAQAFCALGALQRVNTKHAKKAERYLQEAACEFKGDRHGTACQEDIFAVNDRDHTKEVHRDVLKMFTKAIHLAKVAARAKPR